VNEAIVAGPAFRLEHGLGAGITSSAAGHFGRYARESGPIVLTLSFVGFDPKADISNPLVSHRQLGASD